MDEEKIGIINADENYIIKSTNQEILKILNLSSNDLIGKHLDYIDEHVDKLQTNLERYSVSTYPTYNEKHVISGYVKIVSKKSNKPKIDSLDKNSLDIIDFYSKVLDDHLFIITCKFTPDYILTSVSKGYSRYFGISEDELFGKSFLEFVPNEEQKKVKDKISKITIDNQYDEFDHEVILPNGEKRWHRWINRGIFDEENNIIEYQALGRDVTDQKEAKIRLYKLIDVLVNMSVDYNENIKLITKTCGELLNATYTVFCKLDNDKLCGIGVWNEPHDYENMYPAEGCICTDILNNKSIDRLFVINNLLKTKYAKTDRNVKKYRLKTYYGKPIKCSGKTVGVLCIKFDYDRPISESDKNVIDMLGKALSIEEERREFEDALKESEAKFRTIFENIIDVYYRADTQGKLVMISPSALKMFEYDSIEEQLGSDIESEFYYNPDDRKKFLEELKKTGKLMNYELTLKKKDGSPLQLETNSHIILDKNGKAMGVEGMLRDISLRKKTEAEREYLIKKLEESNRLKTEFLATISHELRTPLAGILGFSELLLADTKLNGNQLENVKYIYETGEILHKVLNDLLEISIIEAGGIIIEYSLFNIEEMINEIYILLKDQIVQKNINFSVKLNHIDNIYSDPSRIRQILFNLIGNAIKFTEKGKIKITVIQKKDDFLFHISDTGIGIEKDKQKIIFEIFRQADNTTTRKYGGTGLGLAICKKLLDAMGGQIWVESKPGKGSDFYFSIPISREKEKKEKKEITSETDIIESKDKVFVLFAEDDDANFAFISKLIEQNNSFTGKGFQNGRELLEEYKNNPNYSVIVLDIQMPEMNGIECFYEIRKINSDIPIIAITAFAMENDRERYLKMGFDDYISKPLRVQDFYKIINKNIENKK